MKTNRQNRRPYRSGFTLIEVMIVLLILAMIAGLGVFTLSGQMEKGRRRTAFNYIKGLKQQLNVYSFDVGSPPTNEQGLAALVTCPSDLANPAKWGGPYLDVTATSQDPWGYEYQYAYPGKNGEEFSIWSVGRDGIDGTDDDIGSWMPDID